MVLETPRNVTRVETQAQTHRHDVEFGRKALVAPKYLGTMADQHDMSDLGRVQVLRRNFRFISILGFACTLIATWEVILTLLGTGLMNGGTAGLVWGFIIVTLGFSLVFASIAGMASMASTSGAQYHWVSEFAPRRYQKFLSYITGITGFSIFFNAFLARNLPMVEGLILILHVVGLFAIIIPLWVLAPRNNPRAVFTEFYNGGGWNSNASAMMVGLSTTITSMIGYDCPVHMSEEIKDASETLPNAMMAAVGVKAVLGFTMIITICFTLGDLTTILASPTGYPFIQIIQNMTRSYAATNTMTFALILTLIASTITEVATASRQLWSFARDGGVPFSSFFSYVRASPPPNLASHSNASHL
ncbi:hypothetical protein N8T08_005643 [Aspergillus melleus]|uniref:Uncharacterized protein n=1 Tax=Aspergillus melleus TaxID=138277 RepID=A0ACC3B1M1_9EURO|nr:hypothetical protein N8T08_005643 [Aspergillus melleus]